ncbi:MAG: hypothetical protein ACM359_01600 [Bacillota bacterium]
MAPYPEGQSPAPGSTPGVLGAPWFAAHAAYLIVAKEVWSRLARLSQQLIKRNSLLRCRHRSRRTLNSVFGGTRLPEQLIQANFPLRCGGFVGLCGLPYEHDIRLS